MGTWASISAGYLLGLLAAAFGCPGAGTSVVAVVVLTGLAFVVGLARDAPRRPSLLGRVVLGLASAGAGLAGLTPARAPAVVPGGEARLEGRLETIRHGREPFATVVVDRGRTLRGEPLPRGARVGVRGLDQPPGTRLATLAHLRPLPRLDNPSPHPALPSLRPLAAVGRARGRPHVRAPAGGPARLAHAVAARLRRHLALATDGPADAISRALLLGDRVDDEDGREPIRGAGLAHVLAVSGLHVTLLAGTVLFGVRWLLLRVEGLAARHDVERPAAVAAIGVALAYAGLVGTAPSAWRAALTATLAWGALALGRRPSPIAVTAAAALLAALLRPFDVVRPAFALSVLATAALVTGRHGGSFVVAGLRASVRTLIATAPVVLWCFGDLPAVGVVANLVAVPFAAVVLLPLVVAHGLVAFVDPGVAAVATGPPTDLAVRAFLGMAETFAALSMGRDLPPPDVAQGLLLLLGCAALLLLTRIRARLVVLVALLTSLALAEVCLRVREQPLGVVRATFLDVGQGDAALVDLPDGRLMVVDAGADGRVGPDIGRRVLAPLLAARRRRRVDAFVLSHAHPDHFGGLPALLRAVPVDAIWASGQSLLEAPEGEASELLARARASGALLRRPARLCGRPWRFGQATVVVHHPCPAVDSGYGLNENSLVVEIRHGVRRLLLAGDVEGVAEARLVGRGVGPVDVLKVPHHGSRTSSSAAFLDALRPSVAVVSVGAANRFGHPHAEVWSRLRERVRCPYRTDLHGAVTVLTDGQRLEVRARRGPPCRAP